MTDCQDYRRTNFDEEVGDRHFLARHLGLFCLGLFSLALFALPGRAQETAAIDAAQSWLESVQNPSGGFGDGPLSPRDSALVVASFRPELVSGVEYLLALPARSGQFDALKIGALAVHGVDTAELLAQFARYRSGEGFSAFVGHEPTHLDSALAVQAMATREAEHIPDIVVALDFLQFGQNADGGWGLTVGSASDQYVTAEVLLAIASLRVVAVDSEVVDRASSFLAATEESGGGFGSPSVTGLVFRGLAAAEFDLSLLSTSPVSLLVSTQEANGSWEDDPFATAHAVLALRADAPNLEVEVVDTPASTPPGSPVSLSLRVTNVGSRAAGASRLAVFRGEPSAEDQLASELVPVLAAGDEFLGSVEFDSGEEDLDLTIVCDVDQQVVESREDDNTAILRIPVSSLPDPAVFGSDLALSPAQPAPMEAFDLSFAVRNLGEQAVATDYRLVEVVAGAIVEVLAEGTTPLLAAGDAQLQLHSLSLPLGEHTVAVELDPEDLLVEAAEGNNLALVTFFVEEGRLPDLVVDEGALVLSPASPGIGDDVTAALTVANQGQLSATTNVSFYERVGGMDRTIVTEELFLDSGATAQLSVNFVRSAAGILLMAEVDPENQVREESELNNRVSLYFEDLPDLAIGFDNISLTPRDPEAGETVSLSATVRNAGTLEASGVPVGLFASRDAVVPMDVESIASLLPGASATVEFTWTASPGANTLMVAVDAADQVLERSEENNRVAFPVFVERPVGPDLQISAIDETALSHSSADLELSGTVTLALLNAGSLPVEEPFTVSLFEDRNGNAVREIEEPVLASAIQGDPIAAGESIDLVLAMETSLSFYRSLVWASVDATDVVEESSEANNRRLLFSSCTSPPAPASFEALEEWFLPGLEIESAPVVVQLTDDNRDQSVDSRDTPDIVFHAEDSQGSAVYAVSGLDGSVLWVVRSSAENPLAGRLANVAAADLDGDGISEIVAVRRDSRLVALDHRGEVSWVSDPVERTRGDWAGAPAIGDLSGNGVPEIVLGRAVLDNAGRLISIGTGNRGRNHNYYGPWGAPYLLDQQLSTIADIDLDGRNELVAGDTVYRLEAGVLEVVWNHDVPDQLMFDGFSAVGNLDQDPFAEIVYASSNRVLILDHDGQAKGYSRPINGSGIGSGGFWNGPPTIADLDGDEVPEILLVGDRDLVAFTNGLGVLWRHPVDELAAMTSATAFDLDGDGIREVLYQDQVRFSILDGPTGQVLWSRPNLSKTGTEYPVVADVDGDGGAEVILTSNRFFDGTTSTQGLHVLGHPSWEGTRPIHNQHSYHISNVQANGTVPSPEPPSWLSHNTFRANAQLRTERYLANLTIGLPRVLPTSSQGVPVVLRVGNAGRTAIPAGISVELFEGDLPDGTPAGTAETSVALLPGQWTDLVVFWTVPSATGTEAVALADSGDVLVECSEFDNQVPFVLSETLLPDLEVVPNGIQAPTEAFSGQIVEVQIEVANVGRARAEGEVTLRLYDDEPRFGLLISEVLLPELGPGETSTATLQWDTLSRHGGHTLHAVVNEGGAVPEERSDNNLGLHQIGLSPPTLPDLSVEALTVTPNSVTAGYPVSVTATVTNRGALLEGGFVALLRLNLGESQRTTVTGPFYPGDHRVVEFQPSTINLSGQLFVEVIADPDGAIAEIDEQNNAAQGTLVVDGAQTLMAVATDKAIYRDGDSMIISIGLSNAGAPLLGAHLDISVFDVADNRVRSIVDRVMDVPTGSSSDVEDWAVGDLLPAPYRLVATLTSASTALAYGQTGFSVASDLSIGSEITTDRRYYDAGETARIRGFARNESATTVATGLTARVEIRDPSGTVSTSWESALAQLLPGSLAPVVGRWDVGGAAAGEYSANLVVLDPNGLVVSSAVETFYVRDSTSGGGLSGSLDLDPSSQGIGGTVAASFELNNGGNSAIPSLIARLEVLEVSTGEISAVWDRLLSLDLGGRETGRVEIETSAMSPGSFLVSLSAILDGGQVSLANEPLLLETGFSIEDATVVEGDSGEELLGFIVRREPPGAEDATIDFETVAGSADPVTDYQSAVGTLTVGAGQGTALINVPVFGDLDEELRETLLLRISNPSVGRITDDIGVGAIEDDDACDSPSLLQNGGAEEGSDQPLGWEPTGDAWSIGSGGMGAVEGTRYFGAETAGSLQQEVTLEPFGEPIDTGALQIGLNAFVGGLGEIRLVMELLGADGTLLDRFDSGDVLPGEQWMPLSDLRAIPPGTRRVRVELTSLGSGEVAVDSVELLVLGARTLTAEAVVVTEAQSEARFRFELSCPSSVPLEVEFATVALEATEGLDFVGTSGVLVFPTGTVSAELAVVLLADELDEGEERFALDLQTDEAILLEALAIATVLDDDGPVAVSILQGTVTEGDDGFTDAVLLLGLSAGSGLPVTVDFATEDNSATSPEDYSAVSGSVLFAPGEVEQTIVIPVVGDRTDELVESLTVELSSPTNATIATGRASLVVIDDDEARLSVGDIEIEEGDEATGAVAHLPVALSVPSDRVVNVGYTVEAETATSPEDYLDVSGVLSFSPGSVLSEILVPITGDEIEEATETAIVVLSDASNAAIDDYEARLTILDDDGPLLSVNDVAVQEGHLGVTTAHFTVSNLPPSTGPVSVWVTTVDGTAVGGEDYGSRSEQVVFAPGETVLDFAVTIHGDRSEETDETFEVRLESPQNAAILGGVGTGTIQDDDTFYLEISDLFVAESRAEAVVEVDLDRPSDFDIQVDWITVSEIAEEGSDFLAGSGTLSIAAGEVRGSITVPLVDDLLLEGPERFWVDFSNPVSAHLRRSRVGIHLLDDEIPASYDLTTTVRDFVHNPPHPDIYNCGSQPLVAAELGADGTPMYVGSGTGAENYSSWFHNAEGVNLSLSHDLNLVNSGSSFENPGWGRFWPADGALFGNEGSHNYRFTTELHAWFLYEEGADIIFASDDDGSCFVNRLKAVERGCGSAVLQTMDLDAMAQDFGLVPGEAYRLDCFQAERGRGSSAFLIRTPLYLQQFEPGALEFGTTDLLAWEGQAFSLSVERVGGTFGALPGVVEVSGGSATENQDFVIPEASVFFPSGDRTTRTVDIQILADSEPEVEETAELLLSDGEAAYRGAKASATATILDSGGLPVLQVADVLRSEGSSGLVPHFIAVDLVGSNPLGATVAFATRNGTALAGEDYEGTSGTLHFPPGVHTQSISLRIEGDTVSEGDEHLWLDLTGDFVAAPAEIRITLGDDDRCGSANLIENGSFEDGILGGVPVQWESDVSNWRTYPHNYHGRDSIYSSGGSLWQIVDVAGFAPRIDAGAQRFEVWVAHNSWSAEDPMDQPRFAIEFLGSDGQVLGGSDTGWTDSPNGGWAIYAPVVVPPPGTRSLRLELSSLRLTGGDANVHFDGVGIRPLDLPTFMASPVSVVEGQSGLHPLDVAVTLSCEVGSEVTVDYSTLDGTARAGFDYQFAAGTLTFGAGVLEQTIPLQIHGDTLAEGNELFMVELRNAAGAGIAPASRFLTVEIVDDESSLSISRRSAFEGNEGSTDFSFVASLDPPLALPVLVSYSTRDYSATAGVDYVYTEGTVQFDPGQTEQVIVVQVLGDVEVEPNEIFFVDLYDSINARIDQAEGRGTIKNDDLYLTVGDSSLLEGDSGTRDLTFQIELSTPSSDTVSVQYATIDGLAEDGIDYEGVSGTVTLQPGDTLANVVVRIYGDLEAEGSETFQLLLTTPQNAALATPDERGTGFIIDDDDCGSPNLIRNPGAEVPAYHPGVPEWEQIQGTTWAPRHTGPAPFEGDSYFAPGNVASGELAQNIDVSLFSSPIDRGVQRFLFEGWVRSEGGAPLDTSRFVVEYRDSPSGLILGQYDSGPIASVGAWTNVADVAVAPVGTRSIRVRLLSERGGGSGYSYSFFDGLVVQALGTPLFEIENLEVQEGDSGITLEELEVRLGCAAEEPVTVDFSTRNGSATAPSDYTEVSGTLVFQPGETSAVIGLEIVGDYLNERLETFEIDFSGATAAVLLDPTVEVAIRDGDLASPPVVGNDFYYTLDEDFDLGYSVSVNSDSPNNDQLQLDELSSTFPYIWVAASAKGTIVKVDTRSGEVLGEYSTSPDNRGNSNPSRTTVGLDGSVWVGNRADSSVTHIGLAELGQCVDRNANGTIETSVGYEDLLSWSNTGGVDTLGGVSTAEDECILHYVKLPYSCTTRHVSVDRDGDVWLGCWGGSTSRFAQIDGESGEILRTTASLGCGGYGGLVDGNGILWSASLGLTVLRWDPTIDPPTGDSKQCINVGGAYGVALGPEGDLYVNEHGRDRITHLAPDGSILGVFARGTACGQGLVVDPGGDVWSSSSRHCSGTSVSHIKGDGTFVGTMINVPTGTTGMAVDSLGKVWAAADQASQLVRIDPLAGPIGADGATPIGNIDLIVDIPGANPYNYSDMTGSQLLNYTAPQGSWTVIQDAGEDDTEWGSLVWNTEPEALVPEGSSIRIEVRAANTLAGLGGGEWLVVENGTPFEVYGRFLQIRVTLQANGAGETPVLSDLGVGTIELPELSVSDLTVGEADGTASIAVWLADAVDSDVVATYSTIDGSALGGYDYVASSGTVTIPAGEVSTTIDVPLLDDLLDELDETFEVLLVAGGAATVADGEAIVTIVDDDPAPAVAVGDTSIEEPDAGHSAAVFTLTLSHPSAFPVTVEVVTVAGTAEEGSDYVATTGTVTFAPGALEAFVEVPVIGDLLDEEDELFELMAFGSVNGTLTDDRGVGSILDNDPLPTLSLGDGSVVEGDEGTVSLSVSLTQSAPSGRTISADWSTAPGSATAGEDFDPAGGTIVLEAGSTTTELSIPVFGDLLDEVDETFLVRLDAVSGADLADGEATGTIVDDDTAPTITVGPTSVHEGDEGFAEASVAVELSAPSGRVVSVDFETVEGTALPSQDFLARSDTLLIPPNTTLRYIAIEVVGDRIDEVDEIFSVVLSNALEAELGSSLAEVTIVDDDEARLVVNDVQVLEGDEGTAPATFTVDLEPVSDREVTVDYASLPGSAVEVEDYLMVEGQLIFPPLTAELTVDVPIVGDQILEPLEESFELHLVASTGAAIADSVGIGTILDDELCLGANRIANPGAEAALQGGVLPHWIPAVGSDWLRWPTPPDPIEGEASFYPGPTPVEGFAEQVQTVDLSPFADRIAAGNQRFWFEGAVRTLDETPSDVARIVVEYLDATGTLVLEAWDSGEIVSPFEWVRVEDERVVPVGTAAARVRLIGVPFAGDSIESFFDDLSLRSLRTPEVRISDVTVAEGDGQAVFGVTLSCKWYQDLALDWVTVDQSALAGEDYVAASGSLLLPSGADAAEVTVDVLADALVEDEEFFWVELSAPTPPGAAIVDPIGVGTIFDAGEACDPLPLGPASDFDVFISEALIQNNSDIEGRAAAGTSVQVANFSVGLGLTGLQDAVLVSGGSLIFNGGTVHNGDVVYVTSASYSNLDVPDGVIRQGVELDFQSARLELEERSEALGALAATGTTDVSPWGEIRLVGSDPEFNVFDLASGDLQLASSLTIEAPGTSTVLVNVRGTSAVGQYFGFFLEGVDRTAVLYNFPTATSLIVQGVGIEGSILAPRAHVQFNNGQINGSLVAKTLQGNGQSNDATFAGCLPLPGGGGTNWCPRSPGYWKNHTESWPVEELSIGGFVYDSSEALALLQYGGPDAASKLARALTATKLNVASGYAHADLDAVIGDADAFLVDHPPGSKPKGADKSYANALKSQLEAHYEGVSCD